MSEFAATVARLRAGFDSGLTLPLDWRRNQLKGVQRFLAEHEDGLCAALQADLGKSAAEARFMELSVVSAEIDHVLDNLQFWTAPQKVSSPTFLAPAKAWIELQPKGVVLVITPWNYPIQLSLSPIVGALAAGNTVLLKPSEISVATQDYLVEHLPAYLDPDGFEIVTGGVQETSDLLTEKFDHIMFTGNAEVGRVVMRAAAENLTPVTLELGGKSPVFVDDTADLATAARRIVWGKFANCGQTCVAPDFVLATSAVHDQLVVELQKAITEFYGKDPRTSTDLGRLVSTKQWERVVSYLGDGDIVCGGDHDAAERYLAPTIMTEVDLDSALMTEEIFGPILPVVRVAGAEEAIGFINSRPHPLALYVFSSDKSVRDAFIKRTTSGSLSFGVPIAQLAVPELPFGGVGESGMGSYHGRFSMRTFSHQRAVFDKPLTPDTMKAVYPPFTAMKRTVMKTLAPLRKH